MGLETGNYISDLVPTNPTPGDPKSAGDDHVRLLKAALLNCFPGFTGVVLLAGEDSGTAGAYVLTPPIPLLAYSTGMMAVFRPMVTNAGASTLNVSGLGVRSIKRVDGDDVALGDLAAGQYAAMVFDGTAWHLLAVTKSYIDNMAFEGVLPSAPSDGNLYYLTSLNGVTYFGGNPTPDYLIHAQGVI